MQLSEPTTKTKIINQMLSNLSLDDYEYVVVVDDDIGLPVGFVDRYLQIVARRGYALSQPARTHNSYIDHYFVAQLKGVESRQTNFVEIGPMVAIHRSAFPVILPFDEQSPMGWGLDFVWPVILARHGLTMGIVDAHPIEHSLRKPVTYYSHSEANASMQAFFARHEHLRYEESFRILRSFPMAEGIS
jgi:hypothetical protein